jgi:hypothetical protein
MELEFVPRFAEAKKQWQAFWEGSNTRPVICAAFPKPGVEPVAPPPYTAGADGNFDPVITQALKWAASLDFLGEAIPFFNLEFGVDHFSALLGGELSFDPGSPNMSWSVPVVDDWDDFEIKFCRDSFWWERTVAFAKALRARMDGRMLIAAPSFVANLDCLAALRGTENLLMDLAVTPEKVVRALDRVCCAYRDIVEAFDELLDFSRYGSINRHGLYSKGRINVLQCDISCMISPEMFREFVIPCLKREAACLDAIEYHLDGEEAIKHLEAICELPQIDVMQWVCGAGAPMKKDWTELYKRFDWYGKGQIVNATPDEICRLWNEYDSKKLCLGGEFASRQEAEEFIENF